MPIPERRKEPRRRAAGEVSLRREDQPGKEFTGRLLDVSDSGFRAVHNCQELPSGQMVLFRHPYASGKARAMWKRILPDHPESIETGFMIVERDSGRS